MLIRTGPSMEYKVNNFVVNLYCFNFSTIKSCGGVSKAFDKSIETMPITL